MDQFDADLNTPLILAAVNGHLSIVDILLEYGADLNAKNKQGSTALELSCRKGFFEISKNLILKYSIMQSGQVETGVTEYPLHIACYEGAYEVVELLLNKGAEIDVLNRLEFLELNNLEQTDRGTKSIKYILTMVILLIMVTFSKYAENFDS